MRAVDVEEAFLESPTTVRTAHETISVPAEHPNEGTRPVTLHEQEVAVDPTPIAVDHHARLDEHVLQPEVGRRPGTCDVGSELCMPSELEPGTGRSGLRVRAPHRILGEAVHPLVGDPGVDRVRVPVESAGHAALVFEARKPCFEIVHGPPISRHVSLQPSVVREAECYAPRTLQGRGLDAIPRNIPAARWRVSHSSGKLT